MASKDPERMTGDYAVSYVLATLIEKSFPKQYAERCEETLEEEGARKKPGIEPDTRAPTPPRDDTAVCGDFTWDTGTFFSNCLGSGCFIMD